VSTQINDRQIRSVSASKVTLSAIVGLVAVQVQAAIAELVGYRLYAPTALTLAGTEYSVASYLVQSFSTKLYSMTLEKPGSSIRQVGFFIVSHNYSGAGDATEAYVSMLGLAGGVTDVEITAVLAGTGASQTVALHCKPGSTGWTANVRDV
jgi:hypothetical protein